MSGPENSKSNLVERKGNQKNRCIRVCKDGWFFFQNDFPSHILNKHCVDKGHVSKVKKENREIALSHWFQSAASILQSLLHEFFATLSRHSLCCICAIYHKFSKCEVTENIHTPTRNELQISEVCCMPKFQENLEGRWVSYFFFQIY